MKPKTLYYSFLIIYMILLAVGSLAPIPLKPIKFSGWDKIAHFLLYIPLGFVLALCRFSQSSFRNSLMVLVMGSLYGGTMELLQNFVSGRTASFYDELANLMGVSAGMFLLVLKEWSFGGNK